MRYMAIVGAIVGWMCGGPLGALLGLVLGQMVGNFCAGFAAGMDNVERRAWAEHQAAEARRVGELERAYRTVGLEYRKG